MSDERIDEIKAREVAATPGEWAMFERLSDGQDFSLRDDMETTTASVECVTDIAEDGGRVVVTIADPVLSRSDADFIAHARTDIPFLLARITELQHDAKRNKWRLDENAKTHEEHSDRLQEQLAEANKTIERLKDEAWERWETGNG